MWTASPPTPAAAAADARSHVAAALSSACRSPDPLSPLSLLSKNTTTIALQVVVIGMSLGYILFVTVLHIIGKVRRL